MHQNDNSTSSSRLYSRDAGIVQHKEIHQCNPLHKQTQGKKEKVIPLDAEKAFDKIQHPFMINVLERSGIQGPFINIVKAIYCKLAVNIKLSGEKLEAISLKSGTRQGDHFLPIYSI